MSAPAADPPVEGAVSRDDRAVSHAGRARRLAPNDGRDHERLSTPRQLAGKPEQLLSHGAPDAVSESPCRTIARPSPQAPGARVAGALSPPGPGRNRRSDRPPPRHPLRPAAAPGESRG